MCDKNISIATCVCEEGGFCGGIMSRGLLSREGLCPGGLFPRGIFSRGAFFPTIILSSGSFKVLSLHPSKLVILVPIQLSVKYSAKLQLLHERYFFPHFQQFLQAGTSLVGGWGGGGEVGVVVGRWGLGGIVRWSRFMLAAFSRPNQ